MSMLLNFWVVIFSVPIEILAFGHALHRQGWTSDRKTCSQCLWTTNMRISDPHQAQLTAGGGGANGCEGIAKRTWWPLNVFNVKWILHVKLRGKMNVNLFAMSSNQVTLVSLQQLINCLRSWLAADLIWHRIGEFDRAGNSGQEYTQVGSLCVPEKF